MKVGDLIEVYHHIPRFESGIIPVGRTDSGIIVEINHGDPDTRPLVHYLTDAGNIASAQLGATSGVAVTVKVIHEYR